MSSQGTATSLSGQPVCPSSTATTDRLASEPLQHGVTGGVNTLQSREPWLMTARETPAAAHVTVLTSHQKYRQLMAVAAEIAGHGSEPGMREYPMCLEAMKETRDTWWAAASMQVARGYLVLPFKSTKKAISSKATAKSAQIGYNFLRRNTRWDFDNVGNVLRKQRSDKTSPEVVTTVE